LTGLGDDDLDFVRVLLGCKLVEDDVATCFFIGDSLANSSLALSVSG
jgi:hypothetical protein